MTCDDYREWMALSAVEALPEEDARVLDGHLAGCPVCREELNSLKGILARTKAALADNDMVRSGIASTLERGKQVIADVAAPRPWWGGRLRWAAAAVILMGVFGVARQLSPGKRMPCRCRRVPVEWAYGNVSLAHSGRAGYPILDGANVVAVRREGETHHVVAVDKQTGKPSWHIIFDAVESVESDGRVVYVAGRDPGGRALVCLDGVTGAAKWRCRADSAEGGPLPSSLALLPNGVCWINASEIRMIASDTGATVWIQEIEKKGPLSVRASENGIFAATSGTLYGLDGGTGRILWQEAYGDERVHVVSPKICVMDGRVIVAERALRGGGGLYCMDASNGKRLWTQASGTPFNLRAAEGKVFVKSGGLEAYDMFSGKRLWSAAIDGCSPVAFTDGKVYLVGGRRKHLIYALDAETGERVRHEKLAGSCTGMVIDGARGFVSGHDGVLYAIRLEDNKG